jgi:hypothetical protein
MGALAGANDCGPCGNLGPAYLRSFCQYSPRLVLDRHAAETGLQPQALSDLVIEISDDDRCHGDEIISRVHRHHNSLTSM